MVSRATFAFTKHSQEDIFDSPLTHTLQQACGDGLAANGDGAGLDLLDEGSGILAGAEARDGRVARFPVHVLGHSEVAHLSLINEKYTPHARRVRERQTKMITSNHIPKNDVH